MRRATPADVDTILEMTRSAFARYAEFAPAGWTLDRVDPEAQRARILATLESPDAVVELFADGAGHFAWRPERDSARLLALFVEPHAWGTGLATRLHDRALATMRERDFSRASLATPAGQARARRFYERERWEPAGETEFSDAFGLELIEYRRAL